MLDRTESSRQSEQACEDDVPATGMLRFAMLAPFATRSFRYQWPADLLTSWAFEMETIILGWYVLTETGSVLWLTTFGALQYLGSLIAPLYGVVGDRIGHKSLLLGMRFAYAAFACTLLAFALLGAVTPLVVLVISAFMGLVRPSDLGVRSALIAETMPARTLISALSMSRTTTDSARVAGALLGASIFGLFGMAPAYVVIAAFYVAGALMMLHEIIRDPEFWVLVAVVVFAIAVWKPARRAVVGMLDQRTMRIKGELDEARRLRDEAEQLLAEYRRKEGEAAAFELNRCLEDVDAIMSPATPQAAPAFGTPNDNAGTYCILANFAGAPAISIPMGAAQGMPLGLQIICAPHQDARALGIAAAFEAEAGLQLFPPPPIGPASTRA